MPPKDTEHGTTQTTVPGKRPMPTHVVPAIPFALSKPKIPRQPPKAGAHTERPPQAAAHSDVDIRSRNETLRAGKQAHELKGANGPGPDDTQKQERLEGETADETPVTALLHGRAGATSSADNQLLNMQTGRADRPPTPPSTDEGHISSPLVTPNPETVRKPTERFDIRQIRTDFPPAFVPAAEQHTPQSATSSQSRPQLPARPPTHPHHPSVGSIVFGGRESSTSSPAPAQSATSAFMPPSYPPQAVHGHAYHASEPSAPRMYPPGYQSAAPWAARHALPPSIPHPHFQPTPHVSFRPSPREASTPMPGPYINGHGLRSRHGSQSSSTAALDGQRAGPDLHTPVGLDANTDEGRSSYPESKNASSAPSRQQTAGFYPPPHQIPNSFQYPEYSASYENVEALRVHLLNSLLMPDMADLADCQLHVSDKQTGAQQSLYSHRVILARSPRLLQIMRDNGASAPSGSHIDIAFALDGKHLRIPALMDAIRHLYGGPLPPFEPYRSGVPSGDSSNRNDDRLELALQHIATATWLQLPMIAQRAIEMAMSLLHWSTLPTLLAFALEGGLSPVWAIDDGSTERASTCSSDDSFTKPESGGSPIHEPHSTFLLHRLLTFIVLALPPNFYLDTTAPQLSTSPRLPTMAPTHQSRPSRSDPRLSQIRFGEILPDDHQRPSPVATGISSVLLSLPFPLLKSLLEHHDLTHRLGPETVSSIMRSVIQERETRRQKALKEHSAVSRDESPDTYLVQNLYWVESVEPSDQHRTGCRLARRRRGIDTPPSTGTEPDRHR